MAYKYKRVYTKHRDFVTRTKCLYISRPGKKRRGVRMAPTGESKKKRNKHQAYLKNKYLIYNNFDLGDMWVTLTYKNAMLPESVEDAHKNIMNEISKLGKKLKRKNIPFVYYVKTHLGEEGRVHHHLIIKNNFPVISYVYDYWKRFGSVKDFKEIYNLRNGRLVNYFLLGKSYNSGNTKECNDKRYEDCDGDIIKFSHSRNLAEPKVETRIYPADSFRENPKPPKSDVEGMVWVIENLNNWFPDIDRHIYQEYELVLKEVKSDEKIRGSGTEYAD